MPIIPLNLIQDLEAVIKSADGRVIGPAPSWRDPIQHPQQHRHPRDFKPTRDRFVGNVIARRYADGTLDTENVAQKIVEAYHSAKDGEPLTPPEEALLSLMVDKPGSAYTKKISDIYLRMTDEEKDSIRKLVIQHLLTEANWQAGRGGGKVPGADTIRPDTADKRVKRS